MGKTPIRLCSDDSHNDLGIKIDREDIMNVRPLHDYVIVRRKEEEHQTAGGIVIPDTITEKSIQGEVLAIGNGRILKRGNVAPLDIKPGDQVLFGKHAGTEIKTEDDVLLVMHETDILGVLEK